MTNKRERLMNNFSTQPWLNHFQSVLNDGHEADDDNVNVNNEFDIVREEPSGNIKELIYI